jgi:SAM-dependent methyltransferase
MTTDATNYDQAKADAFKNSMFGAITGSMLMTTIRLGHELGLFRDLVKSGPATSSELAKRTELSSRHTYEWCLHAAANGVLEYNEMDDTFALPPEHATIMDSDEGLMAIICGLVENISYQYPLLKLAYQSDGGVFWGDMRGFSDACKGFFKPVYEQLLPGWVDLSPALKEIMTSPGTQIADIGCGQGISTRSMASNFPNAQVLGIDYHEESIEKAKEEIAASKLTNADARVVDSHKWADEEEEESYDLVTMFDSFHDMSDPEGVAAEALKALKPGGKIFLIEPYSTKSDATKDKLSSPLAPTFCGFNTCFCTPCGKSVPGKEGLGTVCGTDRYEALFNKVGFSSFETFGDDAQGSMAPATNGFRLMLATK